MVDLMADHSSLTRGRVLVRTATATGVGLRLAVPLCGGWEPWGGHGGSWGVMRDAAKAAKPPMLCRNSHGTALSPGGGPKD